MSRSPADKGDVLSLRRTAVADFGTAANQYLSAPEVGQGLPA